MKPELLYVKDRQEWRAWLEKNHASKKSATLIYYKKHTGKPTIPYEDAVEEAVCFGWIDSKGNKLEESRYIQRYTPRNPKSLWSESNIARVKKMIKEGKMTPVGLKLYKDAMKGGQIAPVTPKEPVPTDLEKELKKKPAVWENFNHLAPSYQLLYVYWVNSAKREETRKARIAKAVEAAIQNKKYPNM